MQTTNTTRRSGFYTYGLVIMLMAFSAVLGAVAGSVWTQPATPMSVPAPAPALEQAEPVFAARTASLSEVDPLIQEQRDLREAKRIQLGLPGIMLPEPAISSPAPSAVIDAAASGGQALEQEMRDLKQFERSLHSSPMTAPADTTTAPMSSGYEHYRFFKEEQLKGAN